MIDTDTSCFLRATHGRGVSCSQPLGHVMRQVAIDESEASVSEACQPYGVTGDRLFVATRKRSDEADIAYAATTMAYLSRHNQLGH